MEEEEFVEIILRCKILSCENLIYNNNNNMIFDLTFLIVRRGKVRSERNENMGRRNVFFLKPETGQERKYGILFCRGDGNESIIRSGGMTLTFLT